MGIARLEGKSGFIGRVGQDPFGKFMYDTLRQEKVNTDYMTFDEAQRTSTVVVALDDEGERSFTFMVRPSADLFLQADDLPAFRQGEWLHCCSIALSAEPSRTTTLLAMQRIREAGGFVSFDPNIRTDLWQDPQMLQRCLERAFALADVVKLSEEELAFMTASTDLRVAMKTLAERFAIKLLLVTQGKAGVQALFGRHFPLSCVPVTSVDTTGAGDAFVAGLLWQLAQTGLPQSEPDLALGLKYAQRCGALATTAKGAMTALPHLAALMAPQG